MKAKKSFVICHLSYVLKFSFFLFLFSFFLLSSCKRSTEPISNPQNLQLTVADVSCTEAWLKLKTQIAQNDSSELKLQLYRNDSLIVNKPLTANDSVLYVDGLQPATSYAFTSKVLNGSKLLAVSAKVEATTMDTTSHNFTWQTFEFGGQGGSSSFYDVAIIDENDIWAVGEIYTDNDKYNAAHWDGEKWELRKIYFYYQNNEFWGPIYSMFSFSKNDIWFGMGSLIHWNGFGFQSYKIPDKVFPSKANKIWGTSDHDLYVVGNNGLIVHYDGRQWTRIESGTDLRLLDIYGISDPYPNSKKILTVGANLFHGPETIVLQIKNNNTFAIDNSSFDKSLTSLWCGNGFKWFLTGYDTFFSSDKGFVKIQGLPSNLKYRIRGSALNNIFIVGERGFIWHYNGMSWKDLSDNTGLYYSVDVKDNIAVVVGNRPSNFVIGPARLKIGKKN